jgi:hypothetical protein
VRHTDRRPALKVQRTCETCRKAPEHESDPHHCAFCRGRLDHPDFDPREEVHEKEKPK